MKNESWFEQPDHTAKPESWNNAQIVITIERFYPHPSVTQNLEYRINAIIQKAAIEVIYNHR